MLVLITYDVNTETAAGRTRLRKVAKQCVNYGRRVQNSVFECILDQAQCVMLKSILGDIIDESVDSLRFYYLGDLFLFACRDPESPFLTPTLHYILFL